MSDRSTPELEQSGVWYCRNHSGTADEDQGHSEADDFCPWRDSDQEDREENDDGSEGAVIDPCDWTPLLFESKPTTQSDETKRG